MKGLRVQEEQHLTQSRAFSAVPLDYHPGASLVNVRIVVACPKELLSVQGKLILVRIGIVSRSFSTSCWWNLSFLCVSLAKMRCVLLQHAHMLGILSNGFGFFFFFFFNTLKLVGFGILLAWTLEMLFCIYSFCTCKTIHCGSFWKRWELLLFPERKASVSWWDCTKSASTMACELLVNFKEAFKQNRKRVLNHWSHEHEKKVQVMVWPTPDLYLSCFFSFSSLKYWGVAPNSRWKWRTTGMKTCSLGHLECVLNRRNKDRCKPAKYGSIVIGFIYVQVSLYEFMYMSYVSMSVWFTFIILKIATLFLKNNKLQQYKIEVRWLILL